MKENYYGAAWKRIIPSVVAERILVDKLINKALGGTKIEKGYLPATCCIGVKARKATGVSMFRIQKM